MPDNKSQRHYFTLTQAKVRGIVQLYKYMGINYIKRDVFQTFNISIYQGHEFLCNDLSLY